MAVGLTGVPGVPAVAVEVREFSSVGENVQTQHPATGELTVLARSSERGTATLVILVRFNFYSSETIFFPFPINLGFVGLPKLLHYTHLPSKELNLIFLPKKSGSRET